MNIILNKVMNNINEISESNKSDETQVFLSKQN